MTDLAFARTGFVGGQKYILDEKYCGAGVSIGGLFGVAFVLFPKRILYDCGLYDIPVVSRSKFPIWRKSCWSQIEELSLDLHWVSMGF